MDRSYHFKQRFQAILMEILGSLLVAVGLYNFAMSARLPLTGFSGVAYLMNVLWNVPVGWTILFLNVPVSLLCWKLLGRGFFARSVRCMIISSLMIDYLAPLFPIYQGERLLAALAAGLIAGFGYALIYTHNASTGGLDFITMAIKVKYPYLPLGKITFALDVLVISISSLVFQDIDSLFYGLLVSFLMSIVVDRAIFGINAGKLALVVTEQGKQICDVIEEACHRGSTILYGAGGYRQSEKQVVLCACSTKQIWELQEAVKRADPASFVIILESNEVHGDGFRTVQFGSESFKTTGD